MFGAAKADALRAEIARGGGIVWRVGIGADAESLDLVRPLHDGAEISGKLCRSCFHLALHDFAGGSVKRNIITF